MTYIKLLTVLAGLALLTACGGGTPADKAGGDTTTDCETNAFHADCDAVESAISSRRRQCLRNDAIHSTCDEVIVGLCAVRANPFHPTCLADAVYLPNRIARCIEYNTEDIGNCRQIAQNATKNTTLTACLTNPFDVACESVPDFMSSFTQARTNRASFCDNSDNVANDLCKGDVVAGVCGLDPFTAICFTGNTYLSPRVADCIKTENTEAEKCNTLLSDTAMNTALTACLTNPFATACESVTAFSSSFADARVNRASFCGMTGNNTKALCMGDNVMGVCGIDPFSANCFADATYLPARLADCIKTENTEAEKCNTLLSDATMNTAITACLTNPFTDTCVMNADFTTHAETAQTNRASFCGMTGNDTNALCMGAILVEVCGVDPFNVLCINNVAYLTNRQTRCVAGATHTTCGALLSGIVDPTDITGITTPTGVLNHADLPATALEAATDTDILSHFVSVGADGKIDLAGVRGTPVTLSRAGDMMDGVTYVAGTIRVATESFVGLLPSTNLGAPLMDAPTDTTWDGSYYMHLNQEIHPIIFDIVFNTGTKAGTITATDTQSIYTTEFDLDFTATGIITGDVIITSLLPPPITTEARGLIGEQGLVGGFVNTGNLGVKGQLFGGFVADNPAPPPPNPCIAAGDCVDTAAWLAGVTPTPPDLPETPRKNQFLKGTSTGFADRANLNIRDVDGLPLVVTTIRTIPFANTDIAAGGAAFFGGELYNGDNASGNDFYYAGVLAGTNVGAPITEIITAEANIRWTGEIRGNATNSSARFTDGEIANFGLNITFDGNDGGTLKSFFAADTVLHFAIDGTFNANGIITGKVELGNRMGTTSTIRNNNIYSPGTLSGIIGQDGVVGVYYSNNNNAASLDGYSGGFVARPTPSE